MWPSSINSGGGQYSSREVANFWRNQSKLDGTPYTCTALEIQADTIALPRSQWLPRQGRCNESGQFGSGDEPKPELLNLDTPVYDATCDTTRCNGGYYSQDATFPLLTSSKMRRLRGLSSAYEPLIVIKSFFSVSSFQHEFMNHPKLAVLSGTVLVIAIVVASIAWTYHRWHQSITNPATSVLNEPTKPSSAISGNTSTSAAGAWATYADPEGLFSIGYPSDQLSFITTSTFDFAASYPATQIVLENTEAATGGDNSLDLMIVPDDARFGTAANSAGLLEAAVSNPGVTGQLYKASDGTITAFLTSTEKDITSTFELSFGIPAMALTPNIQPLPSYWRQLLDSFRILQPVARGDQ